MKRILKNTSNSIIVILAIFFYMILAIFINGIPGDKNFGILIVNFFNLFMWLFLFIKEVKSKPYSFVSMHWLFCVFFFGFAPLVQYIVGWFPWIRERSDGVLIKANFLLIVWTLAVEIGIYIAKKFCLTKNNDVTVSYIPKNDIGNFLRVLPLITIINFIFTAYKIASIGLGNMLSRGTNTGVSLSDSGTVSMVIMSVLQGIVFFTVALSIVKYKKNKKNALYLIINGVLLVIGFFPTGMARYAAAVIYLGLLIIFFEKLKKNRLFIIMFIFAFTILLPAFNAFRRISFAEVNFIGVIKDVLSKSVFVWADYDYDAYTQFTMTLEYVQKYEIKSNHLLTVLLFYIPRSLWPNKSLSGSYEMAHKLGTFDNVSFPLPAISYMDGGIIGMILFGIIIGYLMKKFDDYYWKRAHGIDRVTDLDILYPPLMIFWFFMCRGDLFFIFPYMFCFVVAWFLLKYAGRIRVRW